MKKWYLLIIIIIQAGLLAACGNDADQDEQAGQEDDSSGSEAVTIEDAYGEQTFDQTPERVVVLEWVYAEDLLALGIQPVGMADMEGYHNWVNIEPELGKDVQDVGTRQEPSLEAIAELNPDLIITAGYRHEAIMDSLKEIAPTLAYNPYPAEGEGNQYEEMTATFQELAKLFGKQDKADQVLSDLNSTYQQAEQEIADAGMDDKPFVLSQAYSSDNSPVIRLFKDNAMAVQIMENIGLENAYQSDGFQVYGYDETSVETLQNFQDARFFYIVQENDNIFDDQLKGNPAWENLQFVEQDETYRLPGDTWTFGGPLSAEVFAEQIKEALIE
ncbi:ABC transporter substrate-binding protein [Sediminibacillus dalangtanensis]|uniref:ABC transporter substrate-binding protein n=1 Tax=Sediminibacillus dalangtanensis TaxID=2729421 RepID=A0ABX7VTJ9_9BACI|nr:iron-siderophore ABC transporter substrate-binding protein [Sediminibacillus dalangtanensis]QTN00282.1 ABC transporter substrate-binding protein [Sediminibacillus dalangtanensis]